MMCKKSNAYNGEMKYWSVLNSPYFIQKFNPSNIISKGNWTIIKNSTAAKMRASFEKFIFMPLFNPVGTRPITITENLRPHMRFIQRDGRLKILTVCFKFIIFLLNFF